MPKISCFSECWRESNEEVTAGLRVSQSKDLPKLAVCQLETAADWRFLVLDRDERAVKVVLLKPMWHKFDRQTNIFLGSSLQQDINLWLEKQWQNFYLMIKVGRWPQEFIQNDFLKSNCLGKIGLLELEEWREILKKRPEVVPNLLRVAQIFCPWFNLAFLNKEADGSEVIQSLRSDGSVTSQIAGLPLVVYPVFYLPMFKICEGRGNWENPYVIIDLF